MLGPVPADEMRALAERGNAEAQYRLGLRMLGVDEGAGAGWLQRAAQSGHLQAQAELGTRLVDGVGVDVDAARGVALLKSAAQRDSVQAQLRLARCYRDGEGVEASAVEWRRGRTVSFRLLGLRVVQQSDGTPIGLGRSVVRNVVCCSILLLPTMVACVVIAVAFVMGASPPNDLFSKPRHAPWDRLTRTTVVQERRRPFSRGKYAQLSEWPPANEPVSMN